MINLTTKRKILNVTLLALGLFALGMLSGCESMGLRSRDDVQEQNKDKELRTQVSAVQKSRADQESRINDLQQDMKVFAGRLEVLEHNQDKVGGDQKQELETLKKQNEILTERIRLLESHVDASEMRIMSALNVASGEGSSTVGVGSARAKTSGKSGAGAPGAGAATAPLVGGKSAGGAVSHPNVVAAEASTGKNDDLYEEGEKYFAAKDWKKAMFSYNKYRDQYPKGKNAAEASYKIGVCFSELGMKKEAKAFYETTLSDYPNSPASRKARYRISIMK